MESKVIYFWQEFGLHKHLFKNPFIAADPKILKEEFILSPVTISLCKELVNYSE